MSMNQFLVAACSVALSTFAFAQRTTWPVAGTHCYVGTIAAENGPQRIQMTLSLPDVPGQLGSDAQAVSGECRRERRGVSMRLVGDGIDTKGFLIVREYAPSDQGDGDGARVCTGRFEGRIDGGARRFYGTWIGTDGKQRRSFDVQLVAVGQEVGMRTPLGGTWADQSLCIIGGGALASATSRVLRDGVCARLEATCEVEPEPTWAEDRVTEGDAITAPTARFVEDGSTKVAAFFVGDKLVSVGSTFRVYSGGAHANTTYGCLNLVEREGKVVSLQLADLALTPDFGPKLHELVWRDLGRQGASGAKTPPESSRDLNSFDCFLLSPAGVLFGFAPYEVGAYAEGSFFVHLTWPQLQGLLAPPRELYL